MEFIEATEIVRPQLTDYVQRITKKSTGHNKYICPLCGSGTGHSKTGAFTIEDNGLKWKCFSCNEGGDILDLIGKYEQIDSNIDRLKRACDIYGVDMEYQTQDKTEQYTHKNYTHNDIHTKNIHTSEEPTEVIDFTDFFLQANKDLDKTDYYRGISKVTLDRFKVGFVAEWKHPKAPKAPASPRLIIPITKYSYTARDTRTELKADEEQYKKQKVKGKDNPLWIFNSQAIKKAEKPIFIVEGELDALSIIDMGGEAIALGSTAYIKQLLRLLEDDKPKKPFIISLDKDKAGQEAVKTLEDGLTKLNIPYYEADITGEAKDANEALNADPEKFLNAIDTAQNREELEAQAEKEAYLQSSAAYYLQSFVDGIADSINTPFIPTGFNNLDNALDGGLYEGLYIMGAISSLGKTTMALQIMDQIARAGNNVLIFSLEMARTELMAKSISRITAESIRANGGDMRNAKTTRGITTGKRYAKYSEKELNLINASIEEYGKFASNIWINEGVGDIGTDQIREQIKQHISITGKKPVVLVDYVQILAPADVRATDKQNTDKAVLELKRISRDYKLPLIVISSLNRANYSQAISMEALKESGSLEYGSDVIIGLQFKGTGSKNFDVNAAKRNNPREVEAVILKNRNGATGNTINFEYYPMFNLFKEY